MINEKKFVKLALNLKKKFAIEPKSHFHFKNNYLANL